MDLKNEVISIKDEIIIILPKFRHTNNSYSMYGGII